MQQAAHPKVYVNACTHGNERVGARVLEALKDVPIKQGSLILNIAHKEAFSLWGSVLLIRISIGYSLGNRMGIQKSGWLKSLRSWYRRPISYWIFTRLNPDSMNP